MSWPSFVEGEPVEARLDSDRPNCRSRSVPRAPRSRSVVSSSASSEQSANVRHVRPPVLTNGMNPAMSAARSESARLAARAISVTQSKACVANGPAGANGVGWSLDSACGATPSIFCRVLLEQRRHSLDRLGRTQRVVHDDRRDARHGCVAERLEELRPVVAAGQKDEHPSLRVDHPLHVVDVVDADLIGLDAGERRSSRPRRSVRRPVPRRRRRTTDDRNRRPRTQRRPTESRSLPRSGRSPRPATSRSARCGRRDPGRECRRGSGPRRSGNTPPHRWRRCR